MDGCKELYYGQLDISAALPVRTYLLDGSLAVILSLPLSITDGVRNRGRGKHVIEFPTANLICTELKLYGICLERSINCFLCSPGSHKYSSFAGRDKEEERERERPSPESVSHSPIDCASAAAQSSLPGEELQLAQPNGLSILRNQTETNNHHYEKGSLHSLCCCCGCDQYSHYYCISVTN